MDANAKIYVAGHTGLVGSAIARALARTGASSLITYTHAQLDLTQQQDVLDMFSEERPDYVFLAAARVGGILANDRHPAEFIRDNLLIQTNVIDAAYRFGVRKLLFLGSSCIYPKLAAQPIREELLLSGPLEATNRAYAVAKIAGLEMCRAYRRQFGMSAVSLMPTNLYGPGDNFDLESSHVVPALLRKFHEAKACRQSSVSVWGTGTPRREFLHVDDLADACLYAMHHYDDGEPLNVGWGQDVSIRELCSIVADVVGFEGTLEFDTSRPDGTPRKLLDTSKLDGLGWRPKIPLREGLAATYEWFLAHRAE